MPPVIALPRSRGPGARHQSAHRSSPAGKRQQRPEPRRPAPAVGRAAETSPPLTGPAPSGPAAPDLHEPGRRRGQPVPHQLPDVHRAAQPRTRQLDAVTPARLSRAMTAAAPEVATPPGTTRPARARRITRSPGAAAGLQALSPDAGSHSTVCLPSPARRTGRRLIPVAGCGEPQAAARDRGSRPRQPAPPSGPAQPAPGRAAARTRRPPIPGLPPPRSQKLKESGGAAAPACHRDLGAWPRRLARTARRDHRWTPEAPRTTLPPGPGRSSRPSTAPATTTPAALPSGNPPKALCQAPPPSTPECAGCHNSDPAASRPSSPSVTTGESGHVSIAGADLARMAELVHACADRPPGPAGATVIAAAGRPKPTGAATLDLRHLTVVRPPHTAALNLLPQTPTAQPARHLTELSTVPAMARVR
jgi:hypothetical protein